MHTDHPTAAECCNFNCNQGRTCPRRTMKPSHLKTPRTMNECTFTPGYQSADFDDDRITVWGHVLATVFGVAIIVVLMAVEVGGWLA